jgi:hypothetical protein
MKFRISGTSLALMLLLLHFTVGPLRLAEFLYDYHLWPRPSVEEVRYQMTRGAKFDSMSCQVGENGWDYICDGTSSDSRGRVSRLRLGVMTGVFPVVRYGAGLPLDGPIPDRAALLAERAAERERRQQWLELLNVNFAQEEQLLTLPGVDRELARRIIRGARHKPFATVDELLTVEGVDQALLDRLRPLIRVTQSGGSLTSNASRP